MKIEVHIPSKDEVLANGLSIHLAPKGKSWSESILGPHAKHQGVYVIHHAGVVKYVGKTDGPSMTFGVRLRREFQETAAQGKHIYPKLRSLKVPPDIKAFFFPSEEIRNLVTVAGATLTDIQRIRVFETALEQIFQPEFQE